MYVPLTLRRSVQSSFIDTGTCPGLKIGSKNPVSGTPEVM